MTDNENDFKPDERVRFLTTTLSNLSVIGVGLGLWQDGSIWALLSGAIAILYGYKLSGRI